MPLTDRQLQLARVGSHVAEMMARLFELRTTLQGIPQVPQQAVDTVTQAYDRLDTLLTRLRQEYV